MDEFWACSWYEWDLYLQRYNRRIEKENQRLEVEVYNPLRIIWVAIMNRWRGKGEKKYKPTDLIKLSFDKEEEQKESVKLTADEVERKFGTHGKQ